jgi:putative exosortase-associated protein (TIGR04073 family)
MVVGGQPAWAARTRVHEAAESERYGRKFGGMIGRGALNVITSPVDLIVNIVNETKVGPPLVGTLAGLGKGIGCGTLRLGSGAVDLVTFWVPGFNGFPVSDSYENCMAGSASSLSDAMPAGYPPSSAWEVPTSEPGAAQAPASEPASAKKTWKK